MRRRSVQPGTGHSNGKTVARAQAEAWRREVQHAKDTQRSLKAEFLERQNRRTP